MKALVMWLAMRGLLNNRMFRFVGTWLVKKTGAHL